MSIKVLGVEFSHHFIEILPDPYVDHSLVLKEDRVFAFPKPSPTYLEGGETFVHTEVSYEL